MLSHRDRTHLSKLMSLILRHQPEKFGLALDADGFVSLSDLLAVLQRQRRESTFEADIREIVATSDKQRFEIVEADGGAKIRARYGHSVAEKVTHEPIVPPEVLFHGTSRRALPQIRAHGLRPMQRQYVHLSSEIEQAKAVGQRHDAQPIVLKVLSGAAHRAGVAFYRPEARLYLADAIPPQFIEFETPDS